MKQVTFSNKYIINKKTCQQKKSLIKRLQLLQDPYKGKVSYTLPTVFSKLTIKQKLICFCKKIKINLY